MNKHEKIKRLTTNKTRQLVFTLNYNLIEMYKTACKKNGISLKGQIETHIIKYLDENNLL